MDQPQNLWFWPFSDYFPIILNSRLLVPWIDLGRWLIIFWLIASKYDGRVFIGNGWLLERIQYILSVLVLKVLYVQHCWVSIEIKKDTGILWNVHLDMLALKLFTRCLNVSRIIKVIHCFCKHHTCQSTLNYSHVFLFLTNSAKCIHEWQILWH